MWANSESNILNSGARLFIQGAIFFRFDGRALTFRTLVFELFFGISNGALGKQSRNFYLCYAHKYSNLCECNGNACVCVQLWLIGNLNNLLKMRCTIARTICFRPKMDWQKFTYQQPTTNRRKFVWQRALCSAVPKNDQVRAHTSKIKEQTFFRNVDAVACQLAMCYIWSHTHTQTNSQHKKVN